MEKEFKQEIPQFGTKEFNDLCSTFFGGKPKQETLEEAAEKYDYSQGVEYCAYIEGSNGNKNNTRKCIVI